MADFSSLPVAGDCMPAAPNSEELLSLKFSPLTLQNASFEWLLTLSLIVFLPLHAVLKGEDVSLKVQSISK